MLVIEGLHICKEDYGQITISIIRLDEDYSIYKLLVAVLKIDLHDCNYVR